MNHGRSEWLANAQCPECGSLTVRADRRYPTTDGQILRRRRCVNCKHRWYTLQAPEMVIPQERIRYQHWSERLDTPYDRVEVLPAPPH